MREHGIKLKIEELEQRRSILCDGRESLEQELRWYEEEIEGIDIKISSLKQLYKRQPEGKKVSTKIFNPYSQWLKS